MPYRSVRLWKYRWLDWALDSTIQRMLDQHRCCASARLTTHNRAISAQIVTLDRKSIPIKDPTEPTPATLPLSIRVIRFDVNLHFQSLYWMPFNAHTLEIHIIIFWATSRATSGHPLHEHASNWPSMDGQLGEPSGITLAGGRWPLTGGSLVAH